MEYMSCVFKMLLISSWNFTTACLIRPEFFLLVDVRDFYFRSMVEGWKKNKWKSSENDQLNGHFQSFFIKYLLKKQ